MNKTNFSATLDIHDLYSQFTLHIKKGDTTGRLTVTLMEGGRPYKIVEGCYAAFSAKTPDGKPIFNKCVIENNKIVHDLTLNTTAVAGKLGCELLVFGKNEELLVSPRFTIIVDDTVYNGEQIESTEEFSALTQMVSEGNALLESLKNGNSTLMLLYTIPFPASLESLLEKKEDGSFAYTNSIWLNMFNRRPMIGEKFFGIIQPEGTTHVLTMSAEVTGFAFNKEGFEFAGFKVLDMTHIHDGDIIHNYQKKEDDGLETEDKSIVGGINEVNEKSQQAVATATNADAKADSAISTATNAEKIAIEAKNTADTIDDIAVQALSLVESADTKIQANVTAIATNKTSIEVLSATTNTKFATVESKVAKNERAIEKNKTDIAESQKAIEENTRNIGATTERVSKNESDIVTLKSLKQDKLEFDDTYNALTNPVATLKTVANEVARMLNDAPENLDTLEEIALWLKDHPNVAELNATISKHTTDIATNTGAIEVLDGLLTALQANKQGKTDSGLKTTSDSVVGAINELKDDVDEAKGKLNTAYDNALLAKNNAQSALDSLPTIKQEAIETANGYTDALGNTLNTTIDDALTSANNYTDEKIAELQAGTPESFDTLKEIADWIQNPANIIAGLNIENGEGSGSIQQKPDLEGGVTDGKFDFTNKNPNANLTGKIDYGGTNEFATVLGGKAAAMGKRALAHGTTTIAKGDYSHAEGNSTVALGKSSHAEGLQTTAESNGAHSEGELTIAKGKYSHAEGKKVTSNGDYSHAEGEEVSADGFGSHAEGYKTKAEGAYSHASGRGTIAGQHSQTVTGRYNNNKTDTVFEVGIGTSDTDRKNGLEVYKDGTIKVYDKVTGDTKELQSGGGTKLYRHSINCYIENPNTVECVSMSGGIVGKKSTKYENINEAMRDAISVAGGGLFLSDGYTLILIPPSWTDIYNGQSVGNDLFFNVINNGSISRIMISSYGDNTPLTVQFTDNKVEEL